MSSFVTDHPSPLEENEVDRDAEEIFQALPENEPSTSCHITPQEIRPCPKSRGIKNKRTRKKQKSSIITDSACKTSARERISVCKKKYWYKSTF